jgi:hypothetical protein
LHALRGILYSLAMSKHAHHEKTNAERIAELERQKHTSLLPETHLERVRRKTATACLNGLIANGRTGTIPAQLAEKAVRLADALKHALEAISPEP